MYQKYNHQSLSSSQTISHTYYFQSHIHCYERLDFQYYLLVNQTCQGYF